MMARETMIPGAAMDGNFYLTQPLDEFEDVLGVFYGGRGQVGQQLVVTNRRLLAGPLNIKVALEIEAYVVNQAVPGVGDLIKSVLKEYGPMSPLTLWLRHVVSVVTTNNARLLKAPGFRIATDTEQVFNFGIVATPRTMSVSATNNGIRDKAVEVLTAAVAAAKSAPAPSGS